MTTRLKSTLVAGLLLFGTSGMAPAQAADNDHAEHHPEAATTAPGADTPETRMMPGMEGMMTPEMMQIMIRMMGQGMMGGGMPGMMGDMRGGPMAEGMPGRGMMDDGAMQPGMMGRGIPQAGMMGMDGMPMGPMMHGLQGRMGGYALGPGMLYGMPHDAPKEMTPARVETFLSHVLERHGNPRLDIGAISEGEDGSVIAEIVTVDGSLVQRLAFNRFPGFFRQID